MSPFMSGSVLAAALSLGQTSVPPTVPTGDDVKSVSPSIVPPPPTLTSPQAPAAPAAQTPQRGPIISFFMREDRPVLSKISSWFKREPPETPAAPMPPVKGLLQREPMAPSPAAPSPTSPPSNDFPRRLPNPSSQAPAPSVTVAQFAAEPAKEAGTLKEMAPSPAPQPGPVKAGKSPIRAQFANKIGRDEKFEWITGQLELENGVYVLYYASPETVDPYHGRIVLHPQQVDMKDFHRGDLVCVHGQLVPRSAVQGAAPVYRLTSAGLIERPKL